MTKLHIPAPDALPIVHYPPKPEVNESTRYQRGYGSEPATLIRWEWSCTFGRWSAYVRFADGCYRSTYPI